MGSPGAFLFALPTHAAVCFTSYFSIYNYYVFCPLVPDAMRYAYISAIIVVATPKPTSRLHGEKRNQSGLILNVLQGSSYYYRK